MADTKKDLSTLIDQLSVDEPKKQALRDRLEKEGVSDSLMDEVNGLLTKMENDLADQYPQEAKDLVAAEAEFTKTMDEIDADAKKLDQELSADLDKADADQIRQGLK